MPCRHPDVRKFERIRCCLACGEAVFEPELSNQPCTSSESGYRYRRLNYTLGQEIRLIELLPGNFSDAVRCRMHHVNLEDDPAYEAVSYTWATEDGDARKSQMVHFADGNGSALVTKNCQAALRQLRKRGCSRQLWIDAICIDQTNINERNHQVGLMDKIFSCAWRVVMCIQDDRTGAGVDYSALFELLRTGGRVSSSTITTVNHLLNARYFKRVWVIQEVALARAAYLRINDQELLLSPSTLANFESVCSRHNFPVPGVLRLMPGQKSEHDIVTCLVTGYDCQATDPRDNVFAVLSLVERQARALIPVDYSLSLQCVHAYALIAIVSASHNLDVLRHLNQWTQLSLEIVLRNRLGSWAQFNDKDAGIWQPSIEVRVTNDVELECSEPSSIELSKVTFEKPNTTSMAGILPSFRVRAHYLDTITNSRFCGRHGTRRLFDCYGDSSEPEDATQVPFYSPNAESTRRYGGHFECYCSTEDFSRLPAENLILGTLGAARIVGKYAWIVDYFRTDLEVLELTTNIHGTTSVVNLHDDISPSVNLADLRTFVETTRRKSEYQSLQHKAIFTTKYSIGYADVGFEDGDQIFAIDGVSVPFILRRVEPQHHTTRQHYKIISECYLWSALNLDRWNPGTRKGKLFHDYGQHQCPNEAEGQTRMIKLHGTMPWEGTCYRHNLPICFPPADVAVT